MYGDWMSDMPIIVSNDEGKKHSKKNIEESSLRKLIREQVKCALKEFFMEYDFNLKIDGKEIQKIIDKKQKR